MDSANTGELVALAMKRAGVSHLFTLNGGHIWPILTGATEHGIRIIDVRHEQSAAFAAEGWAKVTRECGVAAVTAGPGVTNSPSALAQARGSDTPMFVICGRAARLIREARRPVVIAGGGGWWARAENELRALVETARLPLLVNGMARGMLEPSHPMFFSRARSQALREADLVLVVGALLDFRLNFGQPPVFGDDARFVYVDVDDHRKHRPAEVALYGDLRAALGALATAVHAEPGGNEWLHSLPGAAGAARQRDEAVAQSHSSPVHPAGLIA